jgi:hypothetical protein
LTKLDEHENAMDALFSNLNDSEAKTLNKLLDKIRDPK